MSNVFIVEEHDYSFDEHYSCIETVFLTHDDAVNFLKSLGCVYVETRYYNGEMWDKEPESENDWSEIVYTIREFEIGGKEIYPERVESVK